MARAPRRPQPAIGRVRIADRDDVPFILNICTESMKTTFRINGPADVNYLLDNCAFAITQLDVNDDIIGFMAARGHPLIPSVHPTAWEDYIWTKYKSVELNSRNTLFIHMLCWKRTYSRDLVDNMLSSVFMHDPYVHYICMIKTVISCPQLVPGTSRAEGAFRRVQAIDRGLPGDKLPALLIADRKEICPRLRVRRAVEEDNDDIVPIIERHSERLRELYGDYYVSELVARHPESERVLLVCEHKEVAVGVMCLNTQINFESLEECFELSPFAGLRHPDHSLSKKASREIDTSSLNSDPGPESPHNSVYTSDTMLSKTKIADTENQVEEDRMEELFFDEDQRAEKVSLMALIDLFDTEEEEVEFDIINIDPDLLKLPDFFQPGEDMTKNMLDGVRTVEDLTRAYSLKDKKKLPQKTVPTASTTNPKKDYIIRYKGSSNAFLLELFAMHPDYDERYGLDMLEATYEIFPNRDYCVLCLPSSHTSYPLLEHFTLVTPHSTRLRFINESLYVAHVNSVRGDIRVRPAELYDLDGLYNILEHTQRREALTELFITSLVSRSIQSYMLLAQQQPIGVVVIGPLEDGVSIRAQYALEPEPRKTGTDGIILCGVMSPVMETHSRWYLRDVLRQSKYNTLFWICQPSAKGEQGAERNMMSLAERMMPIRPRRSLPNITGYKELDRIFKDVTTPFALWIIERPLSSFPKVYTNNGIVVVGASRTGLAFLESLIMGTSSRYLTFTNLALVSEHGLPTVSDCLKAADTCIPQEGRYNNHYMKSVPFCYYLDIIPAIMVAIDRKKKCIHLKNGGVKFYDELVLTCGQQFQHPDYLKESLERAAEVRKGMPCVRMLMDNPKYQPDRLPPPPDLPGNVFLINSVYQANLALKKLLRMMSEDKTSLNEDNPIVVYGDCLEAYTCMTALIEIGVAGKDIVFVENFPPEDPAALRVNCFNDEVVDERVQMSLHMMGVQLLRQCRFVKWHVSHNNVMSIRLMTPLHCINIECYAFFYFGLKSIDIHAFKAINECGLVYDGGLVVGPKFDTNDPHIYGAGTCINYSRRLYATNYLHRYYNSEDVGEALAQLFLHKLDPFIANHPDYSSGDLLPTYRSSIFRRSHPSIPDCAPSRLSLVLAAARRWQPVMKFESPIVRSATFPGPLLYMKVRKPGQDLPMEVQKTLPHRGHTLETDKDGNYFCLQLNSLHCVESVTCLSNKAFSPEILSQLYGRHESFFNKLLLRYEMGQITDLFSFFIQPWMGSIYQDNFEELLFNINNQVVTEEYKNLQSMYAYFRDTYDSQEEKESKNQLIASGITSTHSGGVIMSQNAQTPPPVNRPANAASSMTSSSSAQQERIHGPADIPSECGQSANLRTEVAGFWDAMGGEDIIFKQIATHIARNGVTNPQIAPPQAEYFE